MDIEARALSYVLALPPSVAGQHGHDAAFRVAAALVHGFALDRECALSVMRQWNSQRATPPWPERDLVHKIESATAAPSKHGSGYLVQGKEKPKTHFDPEVSAEPQPPEKPRIPSYDEKAAAQFASGCKYPVTLDWLAVRSPVPIQRKQGRATSELFLNTVYKPGERILVFTSFLSQGNFLWTAGEGGQRLARQRNVDPVPSKLPTDGKNGIWFLTQPVTGDWTIYPAEQGTRYGRRHGGCVTRWPYLLLESDDAPESVWLRCLVQLPLRITALYTSGGRSVHALIRVDCDSKAEYDSVRNVIRDILPVLGADPAAMTGVRLSRLPGCKRGGNLQRLVWLDPNPADRKAIIEKVIL